VRQPWIPKVYLSVDYSWEQVFASTVYELVLVLGRDGTDFLDAFPFNQDVGHLNFAFVDEADLLDKRGLRHGG
jgi:hypothetical protein